MAARALFRRRHQSAARARRRAHGQPHHVSLRPGLAPQVRSPVPGPRQSHVFFRRRLPGGELSPPPGQQLRRALRCQFLSLSHPRDGLFRPRGGLRRRARPRVQRHADAVLRDLLYVGLAVPHFGVARHRARAQRRRRARFVCRDRDGQGSRRLPARGAGAVRDRARVPGRRRQGARPPTGAGMIMLTRLKQDLTMAEAVRTPGGARVDLLAVAVIQGDADTDLADYPDDAFDYVVLSQTLQATRQPRIVLEHMLRIGRHGIVSFPNFGHWRIRLQILLGGRMPRTDNLPYAWWDSPNIHFCTIKDFRQLCHVVGARMEKAVALDAWGRALRFNAPWWTWNLLGEQGVFLLSRRGTNGTNGAAPPTRSDR